MLTTYEGINMTGFKKGWLTKVFYLVKEADASITNNRTYDYQCVATYM